MTDNTAQDLINKLDSLLETERTALLAGDLETIGRLLEQKEKLIDRLNMIEPQNQQALEGLHDKVTRNQALLDGALQGIRKVAARMAAMRRIRRSLETYDESGRRQTIDGEVLHKVEKRA
jgi:hypothetical protein